MGRSDDEMGEPVRYPLGMARAMVYAMPGALVGWAVFVVSPIAVGCFLLILAALAILLRVVDAVRGIR